MGSDRFTPEKIAEKVGIVRDRLANGRHIADFDVMELAQCVEQLQSQLAEARLLAVGLNDAVQGRTLPLEEINNTLGRRTSLSHANLRIYDSPESTFAALYGVEFSEIENIGGVDEHGADIECNPKAAMDGMREMGYWGCTHTDTATVHVWVSPESSDSDLLMLLGHELGHIIQDGPFEVSYSPAHVPEEQDADRYGWAAKEAYRMLQMIRPFPDLEAIRQAARKSALLEAATKLWWGPNVPNAPIRMSSDRRRDRLYAVSELRRMANASPAEPPTASGQGETK